MGAESSDGAIATAKAQQMEAAAQQQSNLENYRQYEVNRKLVQPFQQSAVASLNQQGGLLGLQGQQAQENVLDVIASQPGNEFAGAQANRSMLADASRYGQLGGGNIRRMLVEQGINRGIQQQSQYYNQLAGLSGTGIAATNNLSDLGMGTYSNVAQATMAGQQGLSNAMGTLASMSERNAAADASNFGQFAKGAVAASPGIKDWWNKPTTPAPK